ncbi:MAG: ThiF family adenylyltransferase [gamma proteobacterium symbiont of Bathyaustriella thionipta]|nr:ThiF family adenylyltransferase [gamma proteobacterium symbiont of Bathyaustriella thionipta]
MKSGFDYQEAFSRNIGWVTEQEQQQLRLKRVAIAGLGGVGGSHLLTATRMGIGAFHIADLDTFEQANFNRQAGAAMRHVGRAKIDVLQELAEDINPALDIKKFSNGVQMENLDDFLQDVDLYVDGLDFFAVEIRQAVFAACAEKGIPAITAAPLGMGVSLLCFMPGKMSFEEYFGLQGQTQDEKYLRFLNGLSPTRLQLKALVDPTRLDLEQHKGPSTAMGCELCAGMLITQAMKILLKRGRVPAAPVSLQFDAYSNRLQKCRRTGGHRHPLQRINLHLARRGMAIRNSDKAGKSKNKRALTPVERVLNQARWTPSGDNTQPWRFEISGPFSAVIHASDTRDLAVYDLQGHASQLSVGMLLETIRIAARAEGLQVQLKRRENCPDTHMLFDLQLIETDSQPPDELSTFICKRSTQRRALQTQVLSARDRQRLQQVVGPHHRIHWLDSAASKSQVARILFFNGGIRLTIPEAFRVHQKIIEWNARFSKDRIPSQAVGIDPLAIRIMQWAMHSWGRARFLNRYLAGTWLPRLQMDLIPGLRCAAHFVLLANHEPHTVEDYLQAGAAMQRFWLTATSLGVRLQPEMTPLIFSNYADEGIQFSENKTALRKAQQLRQRMADLLGENSLQKSMFMGRLGYGEAPQSRSVRLSLEELQVS